MFVFKQRAQQLVLGKVLGFFGQVWVPFLVIIRYLELVAKNLLKFSNDWCKWFLKLELINLYEYCVKNYIKTAIFINHKNCFENYTRGSIKF